MLYTTIWKNAPKDALEKLDYYSITLEYKRGDTIYSPSEKSKGLYIVIAGLVGVSIIGEESGKEHLLRFFTTGQFFGHCSIFSDEINHGHSTVLEKSIVKLIPKDRLIQVMNEFPSLYKDLISYLGTELRRAENMHVMILENQILPRTAQAIIYLKNLHPEHNWTRSEIANFTASTTSTIIKAMAQLEDMGLIRQTGRSIEILDQSKLLKIQNI